MDMRYSRRARRGPPRGGKCRGFERAFAIVSCKLLKNATSELRPRLTLLMLKYLPYIVNGGPAVKHFHAGRLTALRNSS